MPLVTLTEVLRAADRSDYGLGSFSVVNMEMIMGAVKAAEELNSPIILQVAEVRLKHAPLHLIGPMMIEAAKRANVPVAVHLDHGIKQETIKQALDLGFSSVMFDGSHLPLDRNIEMTREVVRLAKGYGASVEGEIGKVGGSEDNSEDIQMVITRVDDAEKFSRCTGVDALAIAIGNVHGVYKSEPNLQFNRLKEIHQAVKVPLVLHGGSGISVEDFRTCIKFGIKKINVQTATLNNIVECVRNLCATEPEIEYFTYHQCVVDGAYQSVKEHIEAFQSDSRA